MNDISLLLKSVEESVLTLINGIDNLYYLENQTGTSIEDLKRIKNNNRLLKQMNFFKVLELYHLSIRFECEKEEVNTA